MRFGLVIYGSLETRSGGYLYDRKLVEHLRAAGDQVEIVSLPWRNYGLHLTDNLSAGLFDRLMRLEVDVLIQDELNHPSLFRINRRLIINRSLVMNRRGRGKVSFSIASIVHHLRISERHRALPMILYRFVERAYLRSVDGFIFNSRTTRDVVSGYARPGTPAVVASPGRDHLEIEVSPAEIDRRAAEAGALRILFVGSVTRRKGLHTLLAALDRLDPETWALTVVGGLDVEPGYARRQAEFVRGRGWEGRVRFAGYVGPGDLAGVLKRHHLLAGPSQYEGYGIAYLEALGAGLPVIASTGGAAGEFIRPDENGYLIDPDDVDRLADLLGRLHGGRPLLARLGRQARLSFESHPTWDESMAVARNFLVGLRK